MGKFYETAPDYRRLCRMVRSFKRYRFVRVSSIGRSVLGRELFLLRFGQCAQPTLFVGAVHGMEWLTSLLLLRFSEELAQSLQAGKAFAGVDAAQCFADRSLAVIPCLNPDGVEISLHGAQGAGALGPFVEHVSGGGTLHWQANARGVDLNHNFDAGFWKLKVLEKRAGIERPGPTRYGGLCPHSEPETRALVRVCENCKPRRVFAFHSQGEEIYYRYGARTPPRSILLAYALAGMSGYRVADPEGLASHGGFKDWFIKATGRPGFTFEIGRGKNPLPITDFPPIYAQLKKTLLCAALL